MTISISVMYENAADATFDLDYYMTRHMPMVDTHFKPHGLQRWRVFKAARTSGGAASPYSIVALLDFDTVAQWEASVADGAAVFGDIPNFSNKQPVIVVGDLVGASG